jgi:hypothetical protein
VIAASLPAPSRAALVARWVRAKPAHHVAALGFPRGGPVPHRDPRSLAVHELATRGRYRLNLPPPTLPREPWWVRPWNWLRARWDDLWRATAGRVHVSHSFSIVLGDVLLAVVLLGIAFVAYRLLREVAIKRAARVAAEPLPSPPTARALYRRACEAAAAGEYGGAVLQLFAATIAQLERQGALAGKRSATVGELRRQLRRNDAGLLARFDAVAEPFVQRAYAERAIDAPQWERARNAFDALLQGAR